MKNKKGFVMTETLIVTVFLVTIFTFIYVSIVPLLGKYEDMTNRGSNIDIVYKLYAIRKMIYRDANRSTITNYTFHQVIRSDFSDTGYYDTLMEYLELSSYVIVVADSIPNRLSNFSTLADDTNDEMYDYVSKHTNFTSRVIVLLDKNQHTVAHLAIN